MVADFEFPGNAEINGMLASGMADSDADPDAVAASLWDALGDDTPADAGAGDAPVGDALVAPGDAPARTAGVWLASRLSSGMRENGNPRALTTLPAWVEQTRLPNPLVDGIRDAKQRDRDAVAQCPKFGKPECCRTKPADGQKTPVCDWPMAAQSREDHRAIKNKSRWVILAGDYSASGRRRRTDAYQSSGIVFAELDNLADGQTASDARDALLAHNAVLGAWVSASGEGVHLAVAVAPAPSGFDEHACAWHAVCRELELPDDANDKSVKSPNRLAFQSSDAGAWVRAPGDAVAPVGWELPPKPAPAPAHPGDAGGRAQGDGDGDAPAPEWLTRDPIGEWHPKDIWNRNPVALGIRFLSDHASELVVASDGNTATIYRADARTGLLTDDSGVVGELLHSTLGALVTEGWECGLSPRALPVYFSYLASQGNAARTLPVIAANAPTALAIMSGHNLSEHMPECRHPDEFDRDPSVLGCRNGLVDLRTLNPIDADVARTYLVTANTGVDYRPSATHPACELLLPPGDIADMYGWMLGHRPLRSCVAEISTPGAGKTTRRKGIAAALGSQYVTFTRAETLQRQKYNRGGTAHNGGVFNLRAPARFCFAPEITGELDIVLLNDLTGESSYEGRECGIAAQKFAITAHLIMQGNETGDGESLLGIGNSAGGDAVAALRDRLRVFDIPALPPNKRMPELQAQIQTSEFAEAMLNYLIRLAHKMSGFGDDAPESETMAQRLQKQVASERPTWDCGLP